MDKFLLCGVKLHDSQLTEKTVGFKAIIIAVAEFKKMDKKIKENKWEA